MKSLSSVDIKYVLKEMQFLIGGRIDKAYHPQKDEILLQFFVPSKGKHLVRIVVGKAIFLTETKEDQDEPGGFCMYIRRHLESARIHSIEQLGSERIVRFTFETKEGRFFFYAELFGQGNIVITDDKNVITNALQQKAWADREIKKGNAYVYPDKKYDAFDLNEKAFGKLMEEDKDTVLKLAKELGLGGMYAEEICVLANVEKKEKKLSDVEQRTLFAAYKKVLEHAIDAQLVYKDEKLKDVVPFSFLSLKAHTLKPCASFSMALQTLHTETSGAEEFISKHQEAIERVERIVDDQEKNIKALEKQAAEENKKGELIYEQYQIVSDILRQLNEARKTMSFDEMKAKLKGHKIVKELYGREKKVTVEL